MKGTAPRLSKAALSRSVQDLDERIVATCNDLMRMRVYTPRMAVDNTNERARLKRECAQRQDLLTARIREARLATDLPLYRKACDQVFEEMGIVAPAIVSSRQAQLLLHVHLMTILDNQTEMLRKHKKREVMRFGEEVNAIQQEQCMNEGKFLREILILESQIKDLEEKLASCPLRTQDCSPSSPREKHPRREVSSSSTFTLETTVSSDHSVSDDDNLYSPEFVPPLVQSPPRSLAAPPRPEGLVALSASGKMTLTPF